MHEQILESHLGDYTNLDGKGAMAAYNWQILNVEIREMQSKPVYSDSSHQSDCLSSKLHITNFW